MIGRATRMRSRWSDDGIRRRWNREARSPPGGPCRGPRNSRSAGCSARARRSRSRRQRTPRFLECLASKGFRKHGSRLKRVPVLFRNHKCGRTEIQQEFQNDRRSPRKIAREKEVEPVSESAGDFPKMKPETWMIITPAPGSAGRSHEPDHQPEILTLTSAVSRR